MVSLIFSLLLIGYGGAFIIGTKKKWPFFVCPDEKSANIFEQAQVSLKKVFGEDFLVSYNYLAGTALVGVGIWNLMGEFIF
ncbi:MAG: hypothetical protein G3M70_13965 [Candidatus Nitronauta litoralis]|uniref:Uncharacterized protein n=1 Tax=Candidatus Nitronauta litoralis TaxID=2705533 RepID=A0A7T0BXW1_9BACT|nr:MAG: hypothetical protein G3M70_13965 [Candidatus Nitronauta litoralis]